MGKKKIGVVVIGRNEGERLKTCLISLNASLPAESAKVYVDSGSTDGSRELAKDFGFQVLELDKALPFTAARGRNTGWKHLLQLNPELDYIQFIDGDCELVGGWLDIALQTLDGDQSIAIACGRRRERYPTASVYNLLADMEWNTPVGEVSACGGDALMRVAALISVDGYNSAYICGEEPEMCIRLRRKNWRIVRLDKDMTLHDIAMTRFSQWWKRSSRAGWSIAEGRDKYGDEPENYMVKENKSGWFWGAILPAAALVPVIITPVSLLLLMAYPILGYRIYRYRREMGDNSRQALIYGFWCTLSKFPQLAGQRHYLQSRRQAKQATLIEYK